MCLPLILFVIHCVNAYPYKDYIIAYIPIEELAFLTSTPIEPLTVPYYNNRIPYNPWYISSHMENIWSSHMKTTGPLTFGGQVKGKGTVNIAGRFGNDGCNQITSYSAPPTPIVVNPLPTLPANPTLPAITTLPAVILPTTINVPATDNMPSTLSVPEMPLPFILATTTVPYSTIDSVESGLPFPNTVKFSGKVPASGRVRICKHFC